MKKLIALISIVVGLNTSTQAQTAMNASVYDVQIKVDSVLCTIYLTWTKPNLTVDEIYGYKVWVNNILLCYNEGCNLLPSNVDSVVTSFPAFKGLSYTAYIVTYYCVRGSASSDMPANITDIVKSTVQSSTIGAVPCVINCELPIKTKTIKTYGRNN